MAMRPLARVAVVEMVIDAAGAPGLAELQDLNILVVTAGRERSLDEYDALLTTAGPRRHRLIAIYLSVKEKHPCRVLLVTRPCPCVGVDRSLH